MKTTRAILSGALVWLMIFSVFAILNFVPATRDSQLLQGLIAGFLLIIFASSGAAFYYKKGDHNNGISIGLIMVLTALILDTLITVPLFEMPYSGKGYREFFTNPLLWILVWKTLW